MFESIDQEEDNDFIPSPMLSTVTIYSHIPPELQDYDSEDAFFEEFYLNKLNDPTNNENENEWSDNDEPITFKSKKIETEEDKKKPKKNILSKVVNRVAQFSHFLNNFTILNELFVMIYRR